MSFNGLNVTCCRIGGFGKGRSALVPILGAAIWSSDMLTAGTTTRSAPAEDPSTGSACFNIYAALDVWVATGANPDASNSPRHFVPAGETTQIIAEAGDKLAWIAA